MSTTPPDPEIERLGTSEDFERSIIEQVGPCPCPTEGCDGSGLLVRIGQSEISVICEKCQREADEREEQRRHAERIEYLLARSGMTPLLATWTLASYAATFRDTAGQEALGRANAWIEMYLRRSREHPCPNLLIFGEVGTGKTGMAWGIIRRLIDAEVEARFVNFPDLLDKMRDSFSHQRPTHEAMNVGQVPVLAVDDVGAERGTPWAIEQLLLLVDRRRQRLLPTIFTSNYDPDDLAERLGSEEEFTGRRIVSRMIQGSLQHRIVAPDRRLQR
jgi:DNA replication protein DnaC